MREQQLAETVWEHDLAGVQVPGEDQVPAANRHGLERGIGQPGGGAATSGNAVKPKGLK